MLIMLDIPNKVKKIMYNMIKLDRYILYLTLNRRLHSPEDQATRYDFSHQSLQ